MTVITLAKMLAMHTRKEQKKQISHVTQTDKKKRGRNICQLEKEQNKKERKYNCQASRLEL